MVETPKDKRLTRMAERLDRDIRWTLDFLVSEAEDTRRDVLARLDEDYSSREPIFTVINDPVYLATYQIQHAMTYLALNMKLDILAQHAAEYAALRGEWLKAEKA